MAGGRGQVAGHETPRDDRRGAIRGRLSVSHTRRKESQEQERQDQEWQEQERQAVHDAVHESSISGS
jgi:hypothetical protein